MSPRKLVELAPGSVLAVPLFVLDRDDLTRFRAADLAAPDARFAFARVIDDRGGAGFVIEVFDHVGGLDTELSAITSSPRLFPPVAVSGLGVHKRRWRVVGVSEGYDPERDSALSQVRLVLGAGDDLRLWHGGTNVETPVDRETAARYEDWTIWGSSRLEERIVEALDGRATQH